MIFISYRREDSSPHTGRLWDRLCRTFGEPSIFMDLGLPPGVDFVDQIIAAAGSCDVLLVVIGRRWLTGTTAAGIRRIDEETDFVRLEVSIGLQRGVPVIPLLVDGARMPAEHELPVQLAPLARRQAYPLSDARWRSDVERLIEVIALVEPVLDSRPADPPIEGAETAPPDEDSAAAGRLASESVNRADGDPASLAQALWVAVSSIRVLRSPARSAAVATIVSLGLVTVIATTQDRSGGSASDARPVITIYSSLPLSGIDQDRSETMVRGQTLALARAGSRVGRFKVEHVALDSGGSASEEREYVARNARTAAQDDSAVLYLGEYNSEATKVSLPALNRAGLAQISSTNVRDGLTVKAVGNDRGEPERYHPSGTRTYARLVPRDSRAVAALVAAMAEGGCKTATVWSDGSVYGAGLARKAVAFSDRAGMKIDRVERAADADDDRTMASRIASNCFTWLGADGRNADRIYEDVAATAPATRLWRLTGLIDGIVRAADAPIPRAVAQRLRVVLTIPGLRGASGAEDVVAAYRRRFLVETFDVSSALTGYEAMALALDILNRAGDNADRRSAVRKAVFETTRRRSVLGTYSIDDAGDTTLSNFAVYTVQNGRLTFEREVRGARTTAG